MAPVVKTSSISTKERPATDAAASGRTSNAPATFADRAAASSPTWGRVAFVRRSSGDERDTARRHLLSLFDALDPDDPRIVTGRRSLSNALF